MRILFIIIIIVYLILQLFANSIISCAISNLNSWFKTFIVLAKLLVDYFAVFYIYKLLFKKNNDSLNLNKLHFKFLLGTIAGLLLPLIVTCVFYLYNFNHQLEVNFEINFLTLFVNQFGISIGEELVFRALIFQSLLNLNKSFFKSSIISSLIFCIFHLNQIDFNMNLFHVIINLTACFSASLLLCYLYYKFKSIWYPIGWHFGWNICVFLLFPGFNLFRFNNIVFESKSNFELVLMFLLIATTVIIYSIFYITTNRLKN